MARLYQGDKEKLIAVCIAGIDEYSQMSYMDIICKDADRYNYKVLFFTSFSCTNMIDKTAVGEMSIFHLINYQMIDALVLFGETIKEDAMIHHILTAAKRAEVPVLTVDHAYEGCYNILYDYHSAMYRLVRHVVEEHDFQKIEFIGGIPGNPSSEERLDIFKKVMEENNRAVLPEQIHYGYYWAAPTELVMDEICARDSRDMPDAIICANDAMAIVACRRLNEMGYRVPEDIAVTGFDGIHEAMNHVPSLTTACLDAERAVELMFDIMKDLFRGNQISHEYTIDFKIIYGESCGCKKLLVQNSGNNLVQKLYNRIFENHYFSNQMESMIATVSDHQLLQEAIIDLHEHIRVLCASKSWICIVDDYVREINTMNNLLVKNNIKEGSYTSRMNCLVFQNGECFENNIFFCTSDILPNLKKHLNEISKILLAPLHSLDRTIGYIALSYDPGQNDFHQLQSFANAIGNILEILRFHEEQQKLIDSLKAQSTHDALTGILNRRGFFQQLDKIYYSSIKTGSKMAVISIDMDGLKQINDTRGHNVGDKALVFMAEALQKVCGKDYFCSRIGGDEFMVSGIVTKKRAEEFKTQLQELFDEYNLHSEDVRIGFSMGMIYEQAVKELPLDEFIRQADFQMYENKEEHRKKNGYVR